MRKIDGSGPFAPNTVSESKTLEKATADLNSFPKVEYDPVKMTSDTSLAASKNLAASSAKDRSLQQEVLQRKYAGIMDDTKLTKEVYVAKGKHPSKKFTPPDGPPGTGKEVPFKPYAKPHGHSKAEKHYSGPDAAQSKGFAKIFDSDVSQAKDSAKIFDTERSQAKGLAKIFDSEINQAKGFAKIVKK